MFFKLAVSFFGFEFFLGLCYNDSYRIKTSEIRKGNAMRSFLLQEKTVARADVGMNNDTVKKIWHGFGFTEISLELTEGEKNTFVIGDAAIPDLPEGKEYAISVTESGAAVRGCCYGGLMRGFFDLAMQIEPSYDDGGALSIPPMEKTDSFRLGRRMIHICIFAESDRLKIKKLIRLAGALQYTHVVIEFWGTYKYDCLPEAGWDGSYTKDEVRELVAEIREMGMEPVPMINHLGHAAGARMAGGKNVVLDQNPRLHRLFMPDGWSWNVFNPEVRELLRKMRSELYELFGKTEYFHAGLDEAYMFAVVPALRAKIPDYLAEITREISAEGRRPMLWMDMFLPPESKTPHVCRCTEAEMYDFLAKISPDTVLVDWNYYTKEAPLTTSEYLSERCDFDIVTAPWHEEKNIEACADTAIDLGLHGFMMTTWHSMFRYAPAILHAARRCGAAKAPWSDSCAHGFHYTETATLLRKLSFEGANSYEDAGWVSREIMDNVGIHM